MEKEMPVNSIICGDALVILKTLPDESIDCVVTSPPYWNLRDYKVAGQLGLEKTPEEFIANLCSYFEEIKRVLKSTGTCFVNIGDTYGTGSGAGSRKGSKQTEKSIYWEKEGKKPISGFEKSLIGI